MRLDRITNRYPADCSQEIAQFENGSSSEEICARFKEFGGQKSTFDVSLKWDDIEKAIDRFAGLGNPSAVRLKKAGRLAEAILDIANPQ